MTDIKKESPSATVLEIQRMSTEDGPGLRTTVFLKGCSLNCRWCHNPESISSRPQIQWMPDPCIGCSICLETCSDHCLSLSESGLAVNRRLCRGCGRCADACPSAALELMGRQWLLDDLVKEVAKDKVYFNESHGGVTVSGGEPALQPGFVADFFKALKEMRISAALDTSGLCSASALEMILPHADTILFDLKELDPEKHRAFTGGELEPILNNLLMISDFIRTHGRPSTLWIRTPIIPGTTDRHENIWMIGRFLAENLWDVVDRWELCAFNNLCRDKYRRLGMEWRYADTELMAASDMEALLATAHRSGVDPKKVLWTGTTRMEEKQDNI